MWTRTLVLLLTLYPLYGCGDGVLQERNPETGLSSWKTGDHGFSIELVQLVPDYVRAVYASRGLPANLVERVSGYCVMGTIVRNTSGVPVTYNVADWRYVTPDGASHRIRTKSEWVREWREQGVTFGWSILPEAQTFQPGDWGQGFLTIKLPPGAPFSLAYNWTRDGKPYSRRMDGLHCAPEEPQPP